MIAYFMSIPIPENPSQTRCLLRQVPGRVVGYGCVPPRGAVVRPPRCGTRSPAPDRGAPPETCAHIWLACTSRRLTPRPCLCCRKPPGLQLAAASDATPRGLDEL